MSTGWTHFLGLYEPLESKLIQAGAWHTFGLVRQPVDSHSSSLRRDLGALGMDATDLPRVPLSQLPAIRIPAQAVGAWYVLEGAALGGRLILRALETRIGPDILGATQFFSGRSDATVMKWQTFQAALDDFGHANPQLRADAEAGAASTFRAMLAWFTRLCAVELHRS